MKEKKNGGVVKVKPHVCKRSLTSASALYSFLTVTCIPVVGLRTEWDKGVPWLLHPPPSAQGLSRYIKEAKKPKKLCFIHVSTCFILISSQRGASYYWRKWESFFSSITFPHAAGCLWSNAGILFTIFSQYLNVFVISQVPTVSSSSYWFYFWL